jgi:hypothetical protein
MSDLESDLERSPRSNLMAYLEIPYTISYLGLIVSMGISCTVYKLQAFKIKYE